MSKLKTENAKQQKLIDDLQAQQKLLYPLSLVQSLQSKENEFFLMVEKTRQKLSRESLKSTLKDLLDIQKQAIEKPNQITNQELASFKKMMIIHLTSQEVEALCQKQIEITQMRMKSQQLEGKIEVGSK